MVVVDAFKFSMPLSLIFWPLICPGCCPRENSGSEAIAAAAGRCFRWQELLTVPGATSPARPALRGGSPCPCAVPAPSGGAEPPQPAEPPGTRTRQAGGCRGRRELRVVLSSFKFSSEGHRSAHLLVISWNIWTNAAGHGSPQLRGAGRCTGAGRGSCCGHLS